MPNYDSGVFYDDGEFYDSTTGSTGTGSQDGAKKTTLLLDAPFDSAFYSGAPVSEEAPFSTQIALGGRPYRIDVAQYQRNTLPTLRPPQDTSNEPGEQSLNTEGTWRRSASNWILGAGQSYFDEDTSDRKQFFTSLGVDPWEQRELRLQKETRKVATATGTMPLLLGTPSYLYAVRGLDLEFTSLPEAASPVWQSSNIHAGAASTIYDLTTVGAQIYAALGPSGIRKTSFGALTSSSYSTYEATKLAFVNGFMVGCSGNDISWIDAVGTDTSVFTHFDTSIAWTDLISTPTGAYACGNTQGTAEIYYIGLDSSTGGLLPATYAGGLPTGETINSLAYYQGLMLLGTSMGLRLASINQDHGLEYGPVVEIPNGVECFDPRAEFCWFSWTNYNAFHSGLGRVNLARSTEPGLPAYATDIMAHTQGTVTSIATFNNRRYFAVAAQGIWSEDDDYVESGDIDSGWIRYGTTERKIAVSVEVNHEPLPTGASVEVGLVRSDLTTFPCGVSNQANSTSAPNPFPAGQSTGEALRVSLTLNRGEDHTESPVVRYWTLRATPTPFRTDEIILPIILRSTVNTGEETGQDMHFDTLEEFFALKDLEASRRVVTYQEGQLAVPVQVDRVMVRPEKFTDDHSWYNGLVFVRLLTVGD